MGFKELVRIFLGNHNGNGHADDFEAEDRNRRDHPSGVALSDRLPERRGGLNEVRTWP